MRSTAAASLLWLSACTTSFEERPWLVDRPVVLAVQGDPAEAAPGAQVLLRSLFVGPAGPLDAAPLSWAFCLAPRTLAERNGVSSVCLQDGGEQLRPIGPGPAALPMESCSRFGPNAPPSEPGQPPLRAADPDPSGGYYQPIRVELADPPVLAFALQRVSCGLPGAPAELVAEFLQTYLLNRNPVIARVSALEAGGVETSSAALAGRPLAPGQEVALRIEWAAAEAERYPVYDGAGVRLFARTESMRVSWFATGGTFATDRTGRTEAEAAAGVASSENQWTAPEVIGPVWVWIVVRDSRGGVTWAELALDVR